MKEGVEPRKKLLGLLVVVGLTVGMVIVLFSLPASSVHGVASASDFRSIGLRDKDSVTIQSSQPVTVYLPVMLNTFPWQSPFGIESNASLASGNLLARAQELQVGWARFNFRVSWKDLQPNEGDAIRWELLAGFENELRAMKAAGITSVIIIQEHPLWATNGKYGADGKPSHCAAVRADKFGAYAQFLRALAARYKSPEFNVHHWELGNEPDVDPRLVPSNYPFGCWGDIDDPLYGGEHYGEMLKVATPQIKAEDPRAQVWIGGLLLDRPDTTDPSKGKPELFLQGILQAGAGSSFDIVGYHAYPTYINLKHDYDLQAGLWTALGGNTLGKAAFLRQIMSSYGVNKPLFLNETGLMCPEYHAWCTPPDQQFFDIQASHVVRAFVRGFSGDIKGYFWYTLNGPGWRYTGLLDDSGNPKPVYHAYLQLNTRLQDSTYVSPVNYGLGLEAYTFRKGSEFVDVVWVVESGQLMTANVPQTKFVESYTRDGAKLTPPLVGSNYQLQVGFEPIYIVRKP